VDEGDEEFLQEAVSMGEEEDEELSQQEVSEPLEDN